MQRNAKQTQGQRSKILPPNQMKKYPVNPSTFKTIVVFGIFGACLDLNLLSDSYQE